MCGASGEMYKTRIEGVEMTVCKSCAKHGEVVKRIREEEPVRRKKSIEVKKEPETEEMIVPDIGAKLKKKRESMGLDQEKFASMINEKKSILHKIESGDFEPNIQSARRIQRILGIKLVEEYSSEGEVALSSDGDQEEMTIGDMIKIKSRKSK